MHAAASGSYVLISGVSFAPEIQPGKAMWRLLRLIYYIKKFSNKSFEIVVFVLVKSFLSTYENIFAYVCMYVVCVCFVRMAFSIFQLEKSTNVRPERGIPFYIRTKRDIRFSFCKLVHFSIVYLTNFN